MFINMKKQNKNQQPCLKCDKLIIKNKYKRLCDQCRGNFIRSGIWKESHDNVFSNGNGLVNTRGSR